MKKIKLTLIILNIILFVGVVYMGVLQAGMGAQIVSIEKEIAKVSEKHQVLTDSIFGLENTNLSDEQLLGLNYQKPTNIYYFDMIDSLAKLPVR